jgi:hypothetical protein
MKPTTANLFLGALTASALLVGAAHSAILAVGQSLIIGSQDHSSKPGNPAYNICLNGAKAGFAAINYQTTDQVDGPDFTVAFTEAIQGYRFVMANPANTIATMTSKGVSISMTTTGNGFDSHNSTTAKIWVTSNPGADLEKPATSPDFSAGMRGIKNISGSINISGLTSGTVYFFYGG